jgi:hypothetical protein
MDRYHSNDGNGPYKLCFLRHLAVSLLPQLMSVVYDHGHPILLVASDKQNWFLIVWISVTTNQRTTWSWIWHHSTPQSKNNVVSSTDIRQPTNPDGSGDTNWTRHQSHNCNKRHRGVSVSPICQVAPPSAAYSPGGSTDCFPCYNTPVVFAIFYSVELVSVFFISDTFYTSFTQFQGNQIGPMSHSNIGAGSLMAVDFNGRLTGLVP